MTEVFEAGHCALDSIPMCSLEVAIDRLPRDRFGRPLRGDLLLGDFALCADCADHSCNGPGLGLGPLVEKKVNQLPNAFTRYVMSLGSVGREGTVKPSLAVEA